MTMTPPPIDIDALLAAGTPRPWVWDEKEDNIRRPETSYWYPMASADGGAPGKQLGRAGGERIVSGGSVGYENAALGIDPQDGRLIVAAVNALEPHLARIAELERGLKEACDLAEQYDEDPREPPLRSEDRHRIRDGITQLRALADGGGK